MTDTEKKRAKALAAALRPIEEAINVKLLKDSNLTYASAWDQVEMERPDLMKNYNRIAQGFTGHPGEQGDEDLLAKAHAEINELARKKIIDDPGLPDGLAIAQVLEENPELARTCKTAGVGVEGDTWTPDRPSLEPPLPLSELRMVAKREVFKTVEHEMSKIFASQAYPDVDCAWNRLPPQLVRAYEQVGGLDIPAYLPHHSDRRRVPRRAFSYEDMSKQELAQTVEDQVAAIMASDTCTPDGAFDLLPPLLVRYYFASLAKEEIWSVIEKETSKIMASDRLSFGDAWDRLPPLLVRCYNAAAQNERG